MTSRCAFLLSSALLLAPGDFASDGGRVLAALVPVANLLAGG